MRVEVPGSSEEKFLAKATSEILPFLRLRHAGSISKSSYPAIAISPRESTRCFLCLPIAGESIPKTAGIRFSGLLRAEVGSAVGFDLRVVVVDQSAEVRKLFFEDRQHHGP